MPETKPVSGEVCASYRALQDEKNGTIAGDIKEIRSGIGKLLRIVTESNGQSSLCDQVRRNNEFRSEIHELGIVDIVKTNAEFRKELTKAASAKSKRQWGLILSMGGWFFTACLFILSRFIPRA